MTTRADGHGDERERYAELLRDFGELIIETAARVDDDEYQLRAIAAARRLVRLAQAGLVQLDVLLEAVEGDGDPGAEEATGGPSPSTGSLPTNGQESYEIEIEE